VQFVAPCSNVLLCVMFLYDTNAVALL